MIERFDEVLTGKAGKITLEARIREVFEKYDPVIEQVNEKMD